MSDAPWREEFLEAAIRDQPALTVELGRLHLTLDSDDWLALVLYGDALSGMARYGEAQTVYERALGLSTEDKRGRVLRNLGSLYDDRCEIGEAERYYREAIAALPDHASAYIYLGALLAKTGRLAEAEHIHRQATQCTEGEIGEAHLNLGLVQRARGDYVGASTSLRRALDLDPDRRSSQDALADVEAVLLRFPTD